MNPEDLSELGLEPGEIIEIRAAERQIQGIVEADPTVRPGVISMAHAWGGCAERGRQAAHDRFEYGPPGLEHQSLRSPLGPAADERHPGQSEKGDGSAARGLATDCHHFETSSWRTTISVCAVSRLNRRRSSRLSFSASG